MEKEINENIIEIEGKKYKFIEAEKSICCKSCDLRKDRRCHLLHRMCISINRKDKKEGYFKRIEDTTFDLENYTPKGDLKGFPKEIIARMLDYQEEQGNLRDVSIFETRRDAGRDNKGFTWNETKEGYNFWHDVINSEDFSLFFEKYPKQEYQELKNNKNMQENNKKEEDSQDFRINDKVYDIILGQKGKVHQISTNDNSISPICVSFNDGKKTYTLDGMHHMGDKHPRLLHYRDGYDYSVIDFNNLPKRQTPKRWRAEEEGLYNFVSFDNECWFFSDDTKDDYPPFDDANYNSGNYFRTEVEAEIIAQKLNTYFKQLIQEEHEHKGN